MLLLVRSIVGVASLMLVASVAKAEDAKAPGPDAQQIQAWLATQPASADISKTPEAPEAPPPPPRHHGFVIESGLGAMGQLGAMRHVSPTAPWFHTALGYEPLHWLMVLVQGDVTPSNTGFANPPPDPRGFVLWGLSVAARFGVQASRAIGLYAQGEVGLASVTNDSLRSYGFLDSDSVGPYFGALGGIEWYQVSPHYALTLQGGVRSYASIFDRAIDNATALAWVGSAGLKYTF